MIPLSTPNISGNEWAYVKECLDTGWISTGGPFIPRLEAAICEFTGARHAVATNSGTAALHLAMILAGVGPGDLVIVPTITFIAPANSVRYVGADPVFVGCDSFLNMDPVAVSDYLATKCERKEAEVFDKRSGRRVAAIVPVHVFGNPCSIDELEATAAEYGLPIIEDASESLGSGWHSNEEGFVHAGTATGLGVLSFNANKIATCGGGGMLLVSDQAMAERAQHLSTQAKVDDVRYTHDDVGYNYRMTNIAAAVGVAQVERIAEFVEIKRRNWELYREALEGLDGLRLIGEPEGTTSNRWFYGVELRDCAVGVTADGLRAFLGAHDVQTRPVWDLVHRQRPYLGSICHGVESAEAAQPRVVNLPCGTSLRPDEVARVCELIAAAVHEGGTV